MDSHVDMTVHDKIVHDMTVHNTTVHDMTVHNTTDPYTCWYTKGATSELGFNYLYTCECAKGAKSELGFHYPYTCCVQS